MTTALQQMKETLDRVLAPLSEQLSTVDSEIATQEAELKELKEVRTQIVAILRRIDPSLAPTAKKKPEGAPVSEERVREIQEWLLANAEILNANGGITTSSLRERPDFPFSNKTATSKALIVLHDRGVLRLDRIGRGAARYYKVVI